MTGGEQSGEGFRGEENPEVGDEEVEQGEGQPAEEKYSDHGDQKLAGPEKFRRAWTVSENQI